MAGYRGSLSSATLCWYTARRDPRLSPRRAVMTSDGGWACARYPLNPIRHLFKVYSDVLSVA